MSSTNGKDMNRSIKRAENKKEQYPDKEDSP